MISRISCRALFSSLTVGVLTACTSVPITSYPRLASLDIETMDLSEVEIAVRMQDDFAIIPGTAILDVSLVHLETGEKLEGQFILDENPEPLTRELRSKMKSGYRIYRFHMDDETGEAATRHRDKIVEARNAEPGRQHEGTFSANVGFCMQPGGNPFLDPRMTLFLRTDPADTFFTMIKETKVPIQRDDRQSPMPCETGEEEKPS